MFNAEKIKERAKKKEKENKKFFVRLKARIPKDLDNDVRDLHEKAFSDIDCLQCANCCRTLGPRFTQSDIDRISKYLNLHKDVFTSHYLQIDEDGDYVFKSMPCPFLSADNFCSVYEKRPKACAEYPHTDRRKFHQLFTLTVKNTFVCPAVYEIVEGLKQKYT